MSFSFGSQLPSLRLRCVCEFRLLSLQQDASPAFLRRWLVVPFERMFADGAPDTIPSDKLDAILSDPAELSGVLNKALEALATIRTRGLSDSDSTNRATDEFRQATDPLAVWLDRKTILRPDAVTPQDQLHHEYSRNCADAGRPTHQQDCLRARDEETPAYRHGLPKNGIWGAGLVLRRHLPSPRRRRVSPGKIHAVHAVTQFALSCF